MSNRNSAIRIIHKLRGEGFEALLAGGCVRDMLLKRSAKDYDVATSARPDEVIALFRRTLKVGAKFGVVIVLNDGEQTEVATFRTESGYVDGRHPSKVEFTNAREDAARRDFTINAMFYDPEEKKVVDFFGGQEDLGKRVVRTVGNPDERFGEDYLRMLRAIRFACQLDFEIESETWAAVKRYAKKITKISGERIEAELEQILVNVNREMGVRLFIESGLAEAVFGDCFADIEGILKVVSNLPKKVSLPLGLACLFKDFSGDVAVEKCEILKLSRNQIKALRFILDNRGKLLEFDMSLAELKTLCAADYFDELYAFQKAIQKSEAEPAKAMGPLVKLKKRITAMGDVDFQPTPLLDGHELMKLSGLKGPSLGKLAKKMYTAQLNEELKTRREAKKWVLGQIQG